MMNNNIFGTELLGRILEENRKSQNLSLRQLSDRTGIDRQVLSKIEKGNIFKTNIDIINRLIQFFNLKIKIEII